MNAQAAQSNHRIASRSRRAEGFALQAPRRAAEQAVRCRAATLSDELRERKWRLGRTADRLGRSRRTLARWRHQSRTPGSPLSRGRPCKESSYADRLATLQWLDQEGPHLGLPSLRAAFPAMPRCELRELQQDYREEYRATHRCMTEKLTWHQSGRVWAMDHAKPPSPVDGIYAAILSIRDLASGLQLAWRPVRDEMAETTLAVLKPLIDEHGAPLVIKSDNGSAFKSQPLAELLADYGITWLPSPPVTPCYNGSCEAANGSMKVRTRHFAAKRGVRGRWISSDLEQARQQANEKGRPDGHLGMTPAERWQQRPPITQQERADLSAAFEKHRQQVIDELTEPFDPNNKRQQHQVQRQAVRRALLDTGLLTITRRSIPLPLRSKTWDKFS